MSVCDMCAHFGKNHKKQCTFSGNCIVNTYNLHGTGSLDSFMNPKVEDVVVEEEAVAEVEEAVATETYFNPFQRGNGCMLADMLKTR